MCCHFYLDTCKFSILRNDQVVIVIIFNNGVHHFVEILIYKNKQVGGYEIVVATVLFKSNVTFYLM